MLTLKGVPHLKPFSSLTGEDWCFDCRLVYAFCTRFAENYHLHELQTLKS